MVTRSLFTGVSGLQTHLSKMDVLSDNLANINTPGFKKSQVVFQSFLSQQISAASRPDDAEGRGGINPQAVGLGVQLGSINLDMSQGQLERTGINTDLAVQGEGFFGVRESGGDGTLYTRAGSFQIDANGNLTDPASGNVVQGFNARVEDGQILFNPDVETPEDIRITSAMEVIPGSATTMQELVGNLDAGAKKGLDPVDVSFADGDSSVRFEFERYHPTKRQYKFDAVWTENPPSGSQIGDTVTDRVTGKNLEGIMELNEDGQVVGIYENPDKIGMNSVARVEVGRETAEDAAGNTSETAGEYTINETRMSARNQRDMFVDLEPQVTNQFRARVTDADKIEADLSTNLAVGGNSFDVANPGDFAVGDTVVINDDDSDAFVTNITGIAGNTITIADNAPATGPYAQAQNATVERNPRFILEWQDVDGDWNAFDNANHGNMYYDFVSQRQTSSGESRTGEVRIDAGFWGSTLEDTDPGVDDVIYFQIHEGNNNGLFNQIGEEVRPEQRWGGMGSTDSYRVGEPISDPENTGDGSLRSVYNYLGNDSLENIINSTAINNIPNKEFSAIFSASGYHVGAQTATSGTKGSTANTSAAIAAGAAATTMNIGADVADYKIGDLITLQEGSTTEAALVTDIDAAEGGTLAAGQIEIQGFDTGNFENAFGAGSTITNEGQLLVNAAGSHSFSRANDQRLFVASTPPNDTTGGPWGLDAEIGIDIASENWSGTLNSGDKTEFTATRARADDPNRSFMIVRDGDGNDSALFAPFGTEDEPGNIDFSPNENNTFGILNDLRTTGDGGTTTLRDEDEIQVATSSDVFDSEGQQHTVTYRFERKAEGEWMWSVLDPTPVDPDNPQMAGFGRLTFDSQGGLSNAESFNARTASNLPPTGPSGDFEASRIYFNPPESQLQSDPLSPDDENPDVGAKPVSILPNFEEVTQFAGDTDVEIAGQDGTSRGRLQNLNFDNSGILNGAYDNGETKQLAQITLYTFRNGAGLEKKGGTYFAESANSGRAVSGKPGLGGRGSITPGALERSNVDISQQFTQLIGTQRGYQANTRTISTADQMIQELLRLK